ncbi:iron-containing redox enzyme family protein [Frankia sp. AgKG'84/4]|uniref:iron-containing redox enzyme family protein n=1 Tax=Frankia sp. AgKG'84/4 TaxID=573490 RepID=UPI002010A4B5|nr:iron-containing redox enzyme family protein [Frankia sp. AgKG'84/4]MCL9796411.1 iron-containing redox enzyme family protein [Frankia sp. AgKG'84/4]
MTTPEPAVGPGAAVTYGCVLSPAELAPRALPQPRGTLSAFLADMLGGPVRTLEHPPGPDDDALFGEDGALALYCLYELHYRGFAGVADGWEWEPSLLRLRRDLEDDLDARLRREIAAADLAMTAPPRREPAAWIGDALRELVDAPGGPSVSRHLAERGSLEEFREFAIHRSLLQLKEADPHSWAIPRLRGAAKAALVEIQADEYGDGVQRDMHQTLFGLTMRTLGLDPSYGAYLDRVPAATLATVSLPSYLGLHRAHRGALVGHLAVFEMTSVAPMSAYSAALRRHGLPPAARLFFDTHVVADAHHQGVAADSLAAGLVRDEPALTDDLLFGARAAMALEDHAARPILAAWEAGDSSLR